MTLIVSFTWSGGARNDASRQRWNTPSGGEGKKKNSKKAGISPGSPWRLVLPTGFSLALPLGLPRSGIPPSPVSPPLPAFSRGFGNRSYLSRLAVEKLFLWVDLFFMLYSRGNALTFVRVLGKEVFSQRSPLERGHSDRTATLRRRGAERRLRGSAASPPHFRFAKMFRAPRGM